MTFLPIPGAARCQPSPRGLTEKFHGCAVESRVSRDLRILQGQISRSASSNIDTPAVQEPSSSCPGSSVTGHHVSQESCRCQ